MLSTLFVIMALAACGTRRSSSRDTLRGVEDHDVTLGICGLVAKYYLLNHKWPQTRSQFDAQSHHLFKALNPKPSPDDEKKFAAFLQGFRLLDFQEKGKQLEFHYRFQTDQKTFEKTVMLSPGSTMEAIFDGAKLKHSG